MQATLAALAIVLAIFMVATRVLLLARTGTSAFQFGRTNKSDFLLVPVAALYIYTIFGRALGWPLLSTQVFFTSGSLAWAGVFLCAAALLFVLGSLVSFGRSFRVGIDAERPDALVTTGIFAISRNPIYVGFILMLLGQFLVFPNWLMLLYLLGGLWVIHRQILREETFLRAHYGQAYTDYCARVRRYI